MSKDKILDKESRKRLSTFFGARAVSKKVPKLVTESYTTSPYQNIAPTPNKGKYAGQLRFYVFKTLIDWIMKNAYNVEGIFRLSGESTPVKDLRYRFDEDDVINIPDTEDPHTITGALKLYLRESDNPLIPRELYFKFLEVAEGDDQNNIANITQLISGLHEERQWILGYLCNHLNLIIQNEPNTKMGLPNIVIVFGPTIMRDPDPTSMDFGSVSSQAKLVTKLLTNYEKIFGPNNVEKILQEYKNSVPQTPPVDLPPPPLDSNSLPPPPPMDDLPPPPLDTLPPPQTDGTNIDLPPPPPLDGTDPDDEKKSSRKKTLKKDKTKVEKKDKDKDKDKKDKKDKKPKIKSRDSILLKDEDGELHSSDKKSFKNKVNAFTSNPSLKKAKKLKVMLQDPNFHTFLESLDTKKLVKLLIVTTNTFTSETKIS